MKARTFDEELERAVIDGALTDEEAIRNAGASEERRTLVPSGSGHLSQLFDERTFWRPCLGLAESDRLPSSQTLSLVDGVEKLLSVLEEAQLNAQHVQDGSVESARKIEGIGWSTLEIRLDAFRGLWAVPEVGLKSRAIPATKIKMRREEVCVAFPATPSSQGNEAQSTTKRRTAHHDDWVRVAKAKVEELSQHGESCVDLKSVGWAGRKMARHVREVTGYSGDVETIRRVLIERRAEWRLK